MACARHRAIVVLLSSRLLSSPSPLFSSTHPYLSFPCTSPLANYSAAAADGGVWQGPGLPGRLLGVLWLQGPLPPPLSLCWVVCCHWLSEGGQWGLPACCRIIEAGLFDYLSGCLAGAEGPVGVRGRGTGSSVAWVREPSSPHNTHLTPHSTLTCTSEKYI